MQVNRYCKKVKLFHVNYLFCVFIHNVICRFAEVDYADLEIQARR